MEEEASVITDFSYNSTTLIDSGDIDKGCDSTLDNSVSRLLPIKRNGGLGWAN